MSAAAVREDISAREPIRTLLAIDFAPASLAAARWATSFIAPLSDAIVVHVVPAPHASGREDALVGGMSGFAATLSVANVRNVLRQGSPSHWLSTIANDSEVSLMVLGRRARANRQGVGEPNVIERATRRVNCSVLVVPEGTAGRPAHVIAAVDDSAFAAPVLRAARGLALLHAIPLAVLHVLSPTVGAYERVIRSARHMLSGRRMLPARTGGSDRLNVGAGDAAREIVLAAASRRDALVVVGMRGADGAPRGSIGSVARELLKCAPVPVLAVNMP